MKTASCKAKGRRFQQAVANIIKAYFNLPEPDAVSTSMGNQGMDIQLSSHARSLFPWAVECKNTEKLNIWAAIEQAKVNAEKEGLKPLVAFTRNHDEAYVCIRLVDFMDVQKELLLLNPNIQA